MLVKSVPIAAIGGVCNTLVGRFKQARNETPSSLLSDISVPTVRGRPLYLDAMRAKNTYLS